MSQIQPKYPRKAPAIVAGKSAKQPTTKIVTFQLSCHILPNTERRLTRPIPMMMPHAMVQAKLQSISRNIRLLLSLILFCFTDGFCYCEGHLIDDKLQNTPKGVNCRQYDKYQPCYIVPI